MTPRSPKRDQTIPLGIVGGGSAWESHYGEAVRSLKRGRIAAVYASLPEEVESLRRQTGAPLYYSLRKFFEQSNVQAIILLESSWVREWAIQLATARQIPVFVASPGDEFGLQHAEKLAALESEGAVVVPGSVDRATPATLRLRELVATRLGAIQELMIQVSVHGCTDLCVVSVIDWCRSLLCSTVSHVTRVQTEEGFRLLMNCGRSTPLSPPIHTVIHVQYAPVTSRELTGASPSTFLAKVRCQNGEAELIGSSGIRWQSGSDMVEETLDSERTAEQVLLDLFLRRVVGGVVPVPSWADLHAAQQLWASVSVQR